MKPFQSRRLTRLLLQILRYPLTLVAAPPGYGKTTQLQKFFSKRRGVDSVFLSPGDDIPGAFQPQPGGFAPRVLVFDRCDGLSAAERSALRAEVERVVCERPENLHVVLVSRKRLSFLPDRLLYGDRSLLIGAAELTLTRAEADYWFEENRAKLSERVWEQTLGWPALLAHCLEVGGVLSPLCADYVKREILGPMDEVSRGLFLRLSPADDFTLEEAATVTENRKAGLVLQDCWQRGGLVEWDRQKNTYRLHPMLRAAAHELLLASDIDADRLCERYAVWFENRGRKAEAFWYYNQAGSTEKILAMLEAPGCAELAEHSPELVARSMGLIASRARGRYPFARLTGAFAEAVYLNPDAGKRRLTELKAEFGDDMRLANRDLLLGEAALAESFLHPAQSPEWKALRKQAGLLLRGAHSWLFTDRMLKANYRAGERRHAEGPALPAPSESWEEFTPQEQKVLWMYASGFTQGHIAEQAQLSLAETRRTIGEIMRRYRVRNKSELSSLMRGRMTG